VSQESTLVPSAWNILMLRERRYVKKKDTQRKFLHGSRCQVLEARSDVRLSCKECVGPRPSFGRTLVMFDHFWDFDRLVEDEAPRQSGDRGISPILWDFWV
jgi:hypothetical protein